MQSFILSEFANKILQNPDGVEIRKINIQGKELEATVFTDKLLISPGHWKGLYYSPSNIEEAFANTDWNDKEVVALWRDHLDNDSGEWSGFVDGVYTKAGNLYGDLVVVDDNLTKQLLFGAVFGVSPKVIGDPGDDAVLKNFRFENFSIVPNPAVKTTFLNSDSDNDNKLKTKMEIDKSEAKATEVENSAPSEFETKIDTRIQKMEEMLSDLGKTLKQEKVETDVEKKKIEMSELIGGLGLDPKFADLLGSYEEFVADFMAKNPGKSVADAAEAFKAKTDIVDVDAFPKTEQAEVPVEIKVEAPQVPQVENSDAIKVAETQKLAAIEQKAIDLEKTLMEKLSGIEGKVGDVERRTLATDTVSQKEISLSDVELDAKFALLLTADSDKNILSGKGERIQLVPKAA